MWQICQGAIEVILVDGDHKSFLINHAEGVGAIIDTHFQYFAFA